MAVPNADSLTVILPDSARIDTAAAQSDLDSPIDYEAQQIDNLIDERITFLTGNAVVKYKTMTLKAGQITVDWNKHLLIAESFPDSLLTNHRATDGAATDSLVQAERGMPVFSDGSDQMTGERMEFNFATEKGRVLRGRTQFQDGKYFGKQIKRVETNILDVSGGIYTTCNLVENPHFHFWSRKMKIIVEENVIAKPIVLFIGKIPLAILPFGFFPTKSGRHSGLIIPRYGQSELEGRFLREFGYYWAISDYFDARATMDFYEFSGWFARGGFNYAKRYAFSGNVSGSVTRKNFTLLGSEERGWDIAFNHNQTFGTTASLRAAGAFASSDDYYSVLSGNRQEQLRRELRSQATFNKSFGGGRSSFSINLSDVRDLETGLVEQSLPQFNLNIGQRQIFSGKEASTKAPAPSGKIEERSWYENFYFSFSSAARNRYFKTTADTTGLKRQSTANHILNLSYNSPKRFFGWLYLNQSLQFNEDWFDRATRYFINPDSTIGSTEEKGFAARHVFSYNASMNTKLYGLFQPNLGPIKALRHVITPSIGFSYRPDFSDPQWGYYQRLTLPDGTVVLRDRFNGSTVSGKQASMTFSVANLFQIKTGPEDKPKKIDLFNLNFFTSHNFAVEEFRQGDLNANLFASPGPNVSLSMAMTYSFYDYDRTTGQRINVLLYDKNGLRSGNYLRLTNFTAGASIRLQGKGGGGSGAAPQPAAEQEATEELLPASPQDRFTPEQFFGDTAVPWQASFSLSFNYSRSNPLFPIKTAQLSLNNADIQLTKNWRLGVAGQFDLIEKSIVDQRYSIYRDLHCWEMQIFWTPSGIRRGFYFRLSIKAPLLRDIKLEQRGGRASVFGGSNFY